MPAMYSRQVVPRHILYTFLLLVACLFLTAPTLAEVACEDMLCCTKALSNGNECQDCQMSAPIEKQVSSGDCSCTIDNQVPSTETSEALATFVRYELALKEVEFLELPVALLENAEEKPDWYTTEEIPRHDFFLTLSSFPNPPPAVA